MENKKILIIIRRGVAEIEWLTPVLNSKYLKYDIYLIYLTKKSYINCVNSSFYNSYKKKIKNFFVITYNFNFFIRLFLKISRGNIKDFFIRKFYDLKKIKEKLNISPADKFDLVISEFGNNSIWINRFQQNDRSRIIKVPSSPSTYVNFKKKRKKKIICDYLIVNTYKDIRYWSRFANKKNINFFGVPFFDKKIKKTKTKKKSIKILFAYSSYFGIANKKDSLSLEIQLIEIMQFLSKIKGIEISFKIHPHKNNDHYLDIIRRYIANIKIYKNENLLKLTENNDLLITNYESAPAIYAAFCKKPGIEIWKASKFIYDNDFKKSNNNSLGLVVASKNIEEFKKNFYLAIESINGKKNIFDQNYKNFEKIYMKKKNTVKAISSFLNNIND